MRKIIISSIILLTLCFTISSEPKDVGTDSVSVVTDSTFKGVVSKNILYQKSFESDLINVVMDTVTVSKKNAKKMGWSKEYVDSQKGKKIQVEYPKIIEEHVDTTDYRDIRRFKLLDPNGKVLIDKEYDYDRERWYTSENKKYIVFSKMQIEDPFNVISTDAMFYNDKGKVLWQNEERGYFTSIFNSGISIGGFMGFFNRKGKMIGLTPKIEPHPDFVTLDIIDNNNVFFSYRWMISAKSILMLTDSMGHEKWRKELPYKFAKPNEYIFDSKFGIIGIYEKYLGKEMAQFKGLKNEIEVEKYEFGIDHINLNGDIIKHLPLNIVGNKRIKLSEDKSSIYIYSSKFNLMKIDLSTYELIWSIENNDEIEKSDYRQNVVIDNDKSVYTQYIDRKSGMNTKIIKYDSSSGKELYKEEFAEKKVMLFNGKKSLYIFDCKNKIIRSI